MNKKAKSKNWHKKRKKDEYFKDSKLAGYKSRAAYKLVEINDKFKILKNKKTILDLGAAPGSWSQVIKEKIPESILLSVDRKSFETIENSSILIGDFTKQKVKKKIFEFYKKKIDLVLSDMASDTTGNKNLDVIRTGELCLESISFSKEILNRNGAFVSKLFMGSIFSEIKLRINEIFNEFKIFKPKSSKTESKEIYIVCKGLKNLL